MKVINKIHQNQNILKIINVLYNMKVNNNNNNKDMD